MKLPNMRLILPLCLGLASGLAFAAALPAPTIEVLRAEFGLFASAADTRDTAFTPSTVVPLRVGQRYGWVIEVGGATRSLSVREEYLLPMANKPASDPVSENLAVALQRRNQISQRQMVPVDGKIYGEWSVGPREPAGHRHLEVLIEGRVAAGFEFDVQ